MRLSAGGMQINPVSRRAGMGPCVLLSQTGLVAEGLGIAFPGGRPVDFSSISAEHIDSFNFSKRRGHILACEVPFSP